VVSAAFAEFAWPGADPIGRRYRSGVIGRSDWVTVVGVVEDIKVASITAANPPVQYIPLAQMPSPPSSVALVLASGGGDPVAQTRELVRRLDPRVGIGRVTSMDAVVATALAEPLRLRFFLGLFAALALVLGVVGVYSVVSYAVARRQGEFGVRMALGAAGATVARQVVARGLFPVAIGTGAGVALVLLLGRVAGRFLYGVSPADPASLIGASAALLLAGVLASAVPAWRAASVSPVEALRAE
jgi:ABC-type antimicrobial peptide transport system permease subunit